MAEMQRYWLMTLVIMQTSMPLRPCSTPFPLWRIYLQGSPSKLLPSCCLVSTNGIGNILLSFLLRSCSLEHDLWMFEKDDVNRNSIIPWRAQLIRLLHPGVIGVWSLSHLVFQLCWDSLNVTLVGCDTSSIKLNNILGWTQGSLCLRQCFQELLVELCWLSPLPEAEVWWVWALQFLRQELPDCLPQCLDWEVEWAEGKGWKKNIYLKEIFNHEKEIFTTEKISTEKY